VIVAYSGAAGVPMAVPEFCSQWVSPNEKMLLDIIILRNVSSNSVGSWMEFHWHAFEIMFP
jgi:hypothetical protein